ALRCVDASHRHHHRSLSGPLPLAAEHDGGALGMERAIVTYERAYRRVATYLVFLPLLAMTVIEFLNAIGRKLFVPFPGTIESVESLLVVSVYFGVALVALEGGHVNVTIGTDRLPPGGRHLLDALANLLAALVFGVLAG